MLLSGIRWTPDIFLELSGGAVVEDTNVWVTCSRPFAYSQMSMEYTSENTAGK